MLSAILCTMLMMPLVSPSSHHCHRGSVLLITAETAWCSPGSGEVGVNVSFLFVLYFSRKILIIVKQCCLRLTLLLIILYNRSSSLYIHTYILLICSHRQRVKNTCRDLTRIDSPSSPNHKIQSHILRWIFSQKGYQSRIPIRIFDASYWLSRLVQICLKPRNEHNMASSWDLCYKLLTELQLKQDEEWINWD